MRAAVAARRAVDERERRSIERFLELYDALERPFDNDASPVHVTGSAIVVADDGSGVLLHRHKRLGLWLQPGGHLDAGEDPRDAASREACEETGLVVDCAPGLVHVDVHAGGRGHTHLDLRYLATIAPLTPAPPAGESPEVRWFGWAEAIEIADDGLRGALVALRPPG